MPSLIGAATDDDGGGADLELQVVFALDGPVRGQQLALAAHVVNQRLDGYRLLAQGQTAIGAG
jgi:hypothetical protein